MSDLYPWRGVVEAEKVGDHRITEAAKKCKARKARFDKGEKERHEFNRQKRKLKRKPDPILAEP